MLETEGLQQWRNRTIVQNLNQSENGNVDNKTKTPSTSKHDETHQNCIPKIQMDFINLTKTPSTSKWRDKFFHCASTLSPDFEVTVGALLTVPGNGKEYSAVATVPLFGA